MSQRIYRQGIRLKVRVKRWGKSLPRFKQLEWQDKPILVQDKIGDQVARLMIPGMSRSVRGEQIRLLDK